MDHLDVIAAIWAVNEYPHKPWHLLSEEEKGWWRQDTAAVLAALKAAGYHLIKEEPHEPV
jgi:hypothetical protein